MCSQRMVALDAVFLAEPADAGASIQHQGSACAYILAAGYAVFQQQSLLLRWLPTLSERYCRHLTYMISECLRQVSVSLSHRVLTDARYNCPAFVPTSSPHIRGTRMVRHSLVHLPRYLPSPKLIIYGGHRRHDGFQRLRGLRTLSYYRGNYS
jgi:hypothetical protein